MAQKDTDPPKKKKESCFVIMPFSGWFDSYYEEIYCPAIEEAGLIPERADDLYRPSNIVDDIWEYTRNAKVILADLTGKNPNVFYELGLAHAITKPAILITQDMDDIPFDLRSLRIIDYDKNLHNWGENLKKKIIKAIEETIKDPDKAIPTTFMKVKRTPKEARSEEDVAIMRLTREVDSLRREVRSNIGIEKIPFRLDADQAERIIYTGIDADVDFDTIKRELTKRGAPDDWAELRINEIAKLRGHKFDA